MKTQSRMFLVSSNSAVEISVFIDEVLDTGGQIIGIVQTPFGDSQVPTIFVWYRDGGSGVPQV